MNVGYMTNAWGMCAGHPVGVPSVKDLFYISTGSIEEAVACIGQAGFNTIEIFDGNLYGYRNRKDEFNALLAQNGVTLSAVYTAANFIFDEIIEEEFYKINLAVELAVEFGAKYMNVGGGALRYDGRRGDDMKKLAKGLDRFVKLCEKQNLIPSFHHHLDSLVEKESEIDELMALTNINLCVDTAHVYAGGGDPVNVMKKYLERIKYLHLKDYGTDFEALGKGRVDFDRVFELIMPRIDDIQITIEANDIRMDLTELAKYNFEFLKKYLKA